MIHEVESGADDPIASKYIGFLIRLVLYAFCSYAAFFLYTIRKPSIPTSPRAESKEAICKNHSKLQSLFHRIINARQVTSDLYENDGDTPRTSPLSKDDDGKGKNWHPRRSSPTKKRVRLSCIPFEGPRARIDACMAIDKMSGTLILHGGSSAQHSSLGDTHIFHTNTIRWDRLDINQNHRQNHGLAVTNSGIVVSFGGYDIDTDCSRNGNSLRTIDLEQDEMYWKDQHKFSINKEWPGPRRSHGMCNIEHDKVVMFGGRDCLGTALFDMWVLDTAPLRSEGNKDDVSIWTKLKPKGKTRPRVREVVSIAHAGGKIYLFGKTPRSRGEVESFDLSNHKWERQVTCGQEPPEQDCQVHSIENAKRLITISNHEPSACGMFNRMDILDMETTPMTWTTVDNISWCGDWTMIPGPRRSFASALDTSSGFLYVFGGVEGCRSSSTNEPNVLNTLIAVNFSRVISIIKEEESTEDQ